MKLIYALTLLSFAPLAHAEVTFVCRDAHSHLELTVGKDGHMNIHDAGHAVDTALAELAPEDVPGQLKNSKLFWWEEATDWTDDDTFRTFVRVPRLPEKLAGNFVMVLTQINDEGKLDSSSFTCSKR
jgi:hypothetical protein